MLWVSLEVSRGQCSWQEFANCIRMQLLLLSSRNFSWFSQNGGFPQNGEVFCLFFLFFFFNRSFAFRSQKVRFVLLSLNNPNFCLQ